MKEYQMTQTTRRLFLAGLGSTGLMATAACNNGLSGNGAATIDARADATLNYLYDKYPDTRRLADTAAGVLVMPLVTKAGLGFGGSYGRGVLRVGGVSVDYYSATQASFGIQIGAQQYAHTLFFMTDQALLDFRNSPGWAAGADVEYVAINEGENMSADTTTTLSPVVAFVFGQTGLVIGATIEGTKYTRIIP